MGKSSKVTVRKSTGKTGVAAPSGGKASGKGMTVKPHNKKGPSYRKG